MILTRFYRLKNKMNFRKKNKGERGNKGPNNEGMILSFIFKYHPTGGKHTKKQWLISATLINFSCMANYTCYDFFPPNAKPEERKFASEVFSNGSTMLFGTVKLKVSYQCHHLGG